MNKNGNGNKASANPTQIRDVAERMAEVAREQEQHFNDLQSSYETVRVELATTQAQNAAIEKENEMLRTLIIEERQRADRSYRLYTMLVTQMGMADAILRDCFKKAKEAASDFPDMSDHGGQEAVAKALATAESIGQDDQQDVPAFLKRDS